MKCFSVYIQTDIKAVKYVLSYPWSNGIVEVNANCLEVIKRQMYGRIKLYLLSEKIMYRLQ